MRNQNSELKLGMIFHEPIQTWTLPSHVLLFLLCLIQLKHIVFHQTLTLNASVFCLNISYPQKILKHSPKVQETEICYLLHFLGNFGG